MNKEEEIQELKEIISGLYSFAERSRAYKLLDEIVDGGQVNLIKKEIKKSIKLIEQGKQIIQDALAD